MTCSQQQSRALVDCIEVIDQAVAHIDGAQIATVNPELIIGKLRAAGESARLCISSEQQNSVIEGVKSEGQ